MFYNVQGPGDHGPPYKVHKKDMNFYFVSFEGTTLSSVLLSVFLSVQIQQT